jgi:hypothetical protein
VNVFKSAEECKARKLALSLATGVAMDMGSAMTRLPTQAAGIDGNGVKKALHFPQHLKLHITADFGFCADCAGV